MLGAVMLGAAMRGAAGTVGSVARDGGAWPATGSRAVDGVVLRAAVDGGAADLPAGRLAVVAGGGGLGFGGVRTIRPAGGGTTRGFVVASRSRLWARRTARGGLSCTGRNSAAERLRILAP